MYRVAWVELRVVVRGRRRQRAVRKQHRIGRIGIAGVLLALSTQTVAHQDVLSRFESRVAEADRWQEGDAVPVTDGTWRKIAALLAEPASEPGAPPAAPAPA